MVVNKNGNEQIVSTGFLTSPFRPTSAQGKFTMSAAIMINGRDSAGTVPVTSAATFGELEQFRSYKTARIQLLCTFLAGDGGSCLFNNGTVYLGTNRRIGNRMPLRETVQIWTDGRIGGRRNEDAHNSWN